MRNRKHFA